MNLEELIAEFRHKTEDYEVPPMWSDEEITAYANFAEREAARRSLLLMDIESSAVCSYPIVASQTMIALDQRVVLVRRARLEQQGKSLAIKSWREVEEFNENWDVTTGAPSLVIPDLQSQALRLFPIPTSGDTVKLSVFRLPIKDMAIETDSPEINPSLHMALVSGMLALGYRKHDAETFNPEAATFYDAQFDAEFGPPANAISESERARDTSRTRHEAPQ